MRRVGDGIFGTKPNLRSPNLFENVTRAARVHSSSHATYFNYLLFINSYLFTIILVECSNYKMC